MAGRKGVPNKNKAYLMKRLQDMFGDDFDPIIRMAEQATRLHAQAIDSEEGTRALIDSISAWDKIAQYVQPKLKAIEITGENGEPVSVETRVIFNPVGKDDK